MHHQHVKGTRMQHIPIISVAILVSKQSALVEKLTIPCFNSDEKKK